MGHGVLVAAGVLPPEGVGSDVDGVLDGELEGVLDGDVLAVGLGSDDGSSEVDADVLGDGEPEPDSAGAVLAD